MSSWDLPRGRHGLSREVVEENQRQRLVAGVAEALAEHGYAGLTVKHVIEAAGVSRATFYEQFENKREAVLAAHGAVFERFRALLMRSCNGEQEWPLKVKAAVGAALEFAATEPAQAQLLVLDALAGDAEIASQVLACNDHLAALLGAGGRQSPRGAALPKLTEKALIGAAAAIIAGRLMNGEAAMLPELQPELVELILMPYLGGEAAAQVAAG